MGVAERFDVRSGVMKHLCLLFLPFAALLPASCVTADPGSGKKNGTVDFVTQVKPILRERCVICHNVATLPDQHSFETGALAMEGDKKGPIIIPGDPENSRFLVAIKAPDIAEHAMPPVSKRIKKKEIAILAQWIREGAPWPEGEAGRIVPPCIPKE